MRFLIQRVYSFIKVGKFGAVIFQLVFLVHFFWDFNYMYVMPFIIVSQVVVALSFFLSNLCASFWEVSFALSSYSLIFSLQCLFCFQSHTVYIFYLRSSGFFFFNISFIPLFIMLTFSSTILKVFIWILGLLCLFLVNFLLCGLYVFTFIYAQ